MDWFLYENGLHHERVKSKYLFIILSKSRVGQALYRRYGKSTGDPMYL